MTRSTLRAAVGWDAINWARALMWLRGWSRLPLMGSRVLEIGGGRGAMAQWFADQGASVICIDRRIDESAPWEFPEPGRVRFIRGDVLGLAADMGAQIVFLKSVLGAIGGNGGVVAQAKACQAMLNCLAPEGGEVWILENLIASKLHQMLRGRLVPWGGHWRYVSMEELTSFMSSAQYLRTRTFGFGATFGRREWQRRLLGRADAALFDRLVPEHWRYLGAVFAAVEGNRGGTENGTVQNTRPSGQPTAAGNRIFATMTTGKSDGNASYQRS